MDFMSSLAARLYTDTRPALTPQPSVDGSGFGNNVADFAKDYAQTLQNGEETAKAAMVGSADPHALVQALAQTELAVETAVAVRDKVVEAYQEILRMPV